MEKKFLADSTDKGARLDKFLDARLEGVTRSQIKKLIDQGRVTVNGQVKKAGFALRGSEEILFQCPDERKELSPCPITVKIIYEDRDIIAVDKPEGLTVHPPQAGYAETLAGALLYMGKELSDIDPMRKGVVHRLDKETTGVMVLAKNNAAHENLVEQFKQRQIEKEYRALVWGIVSNDHTDVDLPLARDTRNRLRMKISFSKSRQAHTEVDVLKRFDDASFLKLILHTGRMHQIRVHLKFLGFPIVGDKKYGIKDGYDHLFLHSHKLGLRHPRTGDHLSFESPLPVWFNDFMGKRKTLCR